MIQQANKYTRRDEFESWYTDKYGSEIEANADERSNSAGRPSFKSLLRDGNNDYVSRHAAVTYEGWNACLKKNRLEFALCKAGFEAYWGERYAFEIKRGFASARSLRQYQGRYVATLTQEAWEIWQASELSRVVEE